mmetsp:Transcript_20928/g.60402  ORF Transcript_20928/g.60402 Transcript_20928/m.60402 type:complete len:350 (+) Transcript_20928:54-1103(+)
MGSAKGRGRRLRSGLGGRAAEAPRGVAASRLLRCFLALQLGALARANRLSSTAAVDPKRSLLALALTQPQGQGHTPQRGPHMVPSRPAAGLEIDGWPVQYVDPLSMQPPTLSELQLLAGATLGDGMWQRVRALYLHRLRAIEPAYEEIVMAPLEEEHTEEDAGKKAAWALVARMWLNEELDAGLLEGTLPRLAASQQGVGFAEEFSTIRLLEHETEQILRILMTLIAVKDADTGFVRAALKAMTEMLVKMHTKARSGPWLEELRTTVDEQLPAVVERVRSIDAVLGDECEVLLNGLQERFQADVKIAAAMEDEGDPDEAEWGEGVDMSGLDNLDGIDDPGPDLDDQPPN